MPRRHSLRCLGRSASYCFSICHCTPGGSTLCEPDPMNSLTAADAIVLCIPHCDSVSSLDLGKCQDRVIQALGTSIFGLYLVQPTEDTTKISDQVSMQTLTEPSAIAQFHHTCGSLPSLHKVAGTVLEDGPTRASHSSPTSTSATLNQATAPSPSQLIRYHNTYIRTPGGHRRS